MAYILSRWVTTQATSSGVIVFTLLSSDGDEIIANTPLKIGNSNGIAIINVSNAPITLSVVNTSNATIFFSNTIPVKANLRLFKMPENNTANGDCFAVRQFANLLEQIVDLYPDENITVFTNRLGSITGTITGLYQSSDDNSGTLFIITQTNPVALNINWIAALSIPDIEYDNSITYLDLPDPIPNDCGFDSIINIHDYAATGTSFSSLLTGTTVTASGNIYI